MRIRSLHLLRGLGALVVVSAITLTDSAEAQSKASLKGSVKVLAGTSVKVCLDLAARGICDGSSPTAAVVGDSFTLTGYKPNDAGFSLLLAEYTTATGGRQVVVGVENGAVVLTERTGVVSSSLNHVGRS